MTDTGRSGEGCVEIVVQSGESIQHAVDCAPEGAVLHLSDGTWSENVRIAKRLTLRGQGPGRTVICPESAERPALWIVALGDADLVSVFLADLAVNGTRLWGARGALVQGKCHVTIASTDLADCGRFGLGVCGSAAVTVTKGEVVRNGGPGVALWDSAQVELHEVLLSKSETGICLTGCAEAALTQCAILRNGSGIWVKDRARVSASSCLISENGDGIHLAGSTRAEIRENRIMGNRDYGVSLEGPPYTPTARVFRGFVHGSCNTIPGPGTADGNALGAVCPEDLSFLMTKQGGQMDRRAGVL